MRAIGMALAIGFAWAGTAQAQGPGGELAKRTSLAPLPAEIALIPGEKPTVIFFPPCGTMGRATGGFPPFLAMEGFVFDMADRINASGALPARLEPVCR